MSRYTLTEEVKAKYKPIIAEFLEKIDAMGADDICATAENQFKLDLSNTELNPYTLGDLLEKEFGYENHDHDRNGWQMDFWITYKKSSKSLTRTAVISGTGIVFEMFLCVNIE